MYDENEKKKLSKATIRLLRESIKDIQTDRTDTASTLLRLNDFIRIVFNDHKKCKSLTTLIMAGMFSMFDKEVKK